MMKTLWVSLRMFMRTPYRHVAIAMLPLLPAIIVMSIPILGMFAQPFLLMVCASGWMREHSMLKDEPGLKPSPMRAFVSGWKGLERGRAILYAKVALVFPLAITAIILVSAHVAVLGDWGGINGVQNGDAVGQTAYVFLYIGMAIFLVSMTILQMTCICMSICNPSVISGKGFHSMRCLLWSAKMASRLFLRTGLGLVAMFVAYYLIGVTLGGAFESMLPSPQEGIWRDAGAGLAVLLAMGHAVLFVNLSALEMTGKGETDVRADDGKQTRG